MTAHPLQDRHAFKAAREALQMSVRDVQAAMYLRDERTVRGWESGRNDIPGPAAVLLDLWHEVGRNPRPAAPAEAVVTFKNNRRGQ